MLMSIPVPFLPELTWHYLPIIFTWRPFTLGAAELRLLGRGGNG